MKVQILRGGFIFYVSYRPEVALKDATVVNGKKRQCHLEVQLHIHLDFGGNESDCEKAGDRFTPFYNIWVRDISGVGTQPTLRELFNLPDDDDERKAARRALGDLLVQIAEARGVKACPDVAILSDSKFTVDWDNDSAWVGGGDESNDRLRVLFLEVTGVEVEDEPAGWDVPAQLVEVELPGPIPVTR